MFRRVLMIGDVSADPGLYVVNKVLEYLRKEEQYDLIIANCENSAPDSIGATKESVESLLASGVDVLTSGNHWYSSKEVWDIHADYPLIRPYNFGVASPGVAFIEVNGIQVINLVGKLSMPTNCWSIFEAANELLGQLNPYKPILVDFHAQMPFEKLALANYLDGMVSAIVGTHTHVATADQMILPNGSAYITDLGMCGTVNSILGCAVEPAVISIQEETYNIVPPAQGGPLRFNAVSIDLNGIKADQIIRTDFILDGDILIKETANLEVV